MSASDDDAVRMVLSRPKGAPAALHVVLGDYECSMTVRPPGDATNADVASDDGAYIDGISFDGAGHMSRPLGGMPADDFARLEQIMAVAESAAEYEDDGVQGDARDEAHAVLAKHFTTVAHLIDPVWLEDFATFGLVPKALVPPGDDEAEE